jgi:hypothetical protein
MLEESWTDLSESFPIASRMTECSPKVDEWRSARFRGGDGRLTRWAQMPLCPEAQRAPHRQLSPTQRSLPLFGTKRVSGQREIGICSASASAFSQTGQAQTQCRRVRGTRRGAELAFGPRRSHCSSAEGAPPNSLWSRLPARDLLWQAPRRRIGREQQWPGCAVVNMHETPQCSARPRVRVSG